MTGCSNDLGGAKRSNEDQAAFFTRQKRQMATAFGAQRTGLSPEADSLGMTPRRGGAGEHGRALLGFTTHALPIIRGPLRSADRLLVDILVVCSRTRKLAQIKAEASEAQ